MRLYLIRHTRVAAAPGLCYGRTDVPLADDFAAAAARLATRLPAFDRMHSSPARRCRALAETLARRPAVAAHDGEAAAAVDVDGRLQELDFGAWEGRTWAAIDGPEARAWGDDFVRRPCPDGESYAALAARVAAWARDLSAGDEDTVAAITHGGPIRALLAHLLELPLERAFAFAVDCGSVTILQRAGGRWQADAVNLRLADTGCGVIAGGNPV